MRASPLVKLAHPLPQGRPYASAAARFSQTIFDQDWWLDAACPGAWDRVRVHWDGREVGAMAFHVQRKGVFTYVTMPPLTRSMSPLLDPPASGGASHFIQQQAIVCELFEKLPKHDRFERTLEIGCPSVQGFTHAGLAVTHVFTLRSTPGDDVSGLLRRARPKTRRMVQRAQRACEVECNVDIDRFIALHRIFHASRNYIDHEVLRRIFEAAASRGQAEIVFVREDGVDAAALILVRDSQATYCWMAARNPHVGDGSANRLAFVEALRSARMHGTVLDVDGYSRPEVGVMLMKLGFQPVHRPCVNGSSLRWLCYWTVRTLARRHHRSTRHYVVP